MAAPLQYFSNREQPSHLASSAMTIQQSAVPVQYPSNGQRVVAPATFPLIQGASLAPIGSDSSRLSNRKHRRQESIPFGQLCTDDTKFNIPGAEPLPTGKRRQVGSTDNTHEEMFSWCVHYVQHCAVAEQQNSNIRVSVVAHWNELLGALWLVNRCS
jgi:hypothetical protein